MPEQPSNPLLIAARGYVARGWQVIPLHDLAQGHCSCQKGRACVKDAGKHPRLHDWTHQGGTQPAQLAAWWHDFPAANIGIITGPGSKLAVVDVDPRNGGDITLDTLWDTHGRFPETPMVLTGGGGQHYYFATPDELPSFDPGPGINFQAGGGHQVVAPPSLHRSGARYEWEASSDPDDLPLAPLPDWIRAAALAHANRASADGVVLPDTLPTITIADLKVNARTKYIIVTGASPDTPYPSRSDAVFAVVHALIDGEHDDATIAAVLTNADWGISAKPLSQKNPRNPRYLQDTLRWVSEEIARGHAKHDDRRHGNGTRPVPMLTTGPTQTALPDRPVSLGWNDYVNAQELVRWHGQDLHYCYPWKSWLVWTGTHWQRDTSGAVMRLAKQTIKRLATRAADLDDEAQLKTLMSHIKKSLSTAALEAMVRSAQSEDGVAIQPEDFDTHPWLLNVTNGTVDLRTGALFPHRREDMLTKCLAIAYDPLALCSTWEHFLWRIMGGTSTGTDTPDMSAALLEERHRADERARELASFLQRALGYALTGSTREQCLFILHGITKTGKSTFLATVRALCGPYGQQADMASFMHKDRQEVRNDLADLAGSRFVCALESSEGQRLAESLVKQLTGGADLIKARFLFQEHFTFKPQFKIFLGTNHTPVIRDTDGAIWERIRLIPFTVQIPPDDRDKDLESKLAEELPGLLAWAIRGCLDWQQRGALHEPEAVLHATTVYQEESDVFGRFLAECCFTSPGESQPQCAATTIYDAYKAWADRNGERGENQTKFGRYLTEHHFEKTLRKGKAWRLGIAILPE